MSERRRDKDVGEAEYDPCNSSTYLSWCRIVCPIGIRLKIIIKFHQEAFPLFMLCLQTPLLWLGAIVMAPNITVNNQDYLTDSFFQS